jgi:hypothetical protein
VIRQKSGIVSGIRIVRGADHRHEFDASPIPEPDVPILQIAGVAATVLEVESRRREARLGAVEIGDDENHVVERGSC